MSLMRTVTEHVIRLGRATGQDIAPLCPEATRAQVLQALNNAAYFGFLRKVGEIPPEGFGQGRAWAVYAPTAKRHDRLPKRRRRPPPPSSVWDYAQRAAA